MPKYSRSRSRSRDSDRKSKKSHKHKDKKKHKRSSRSRDRSYRGSRDKETSSRRDREGAEHRRNDNDSRFRDQDYQYGANAGNMPQREFNGGFGGSNNNNGSSGYYREEVKSSRFDERPANQTQNQSQQEAPGNLPKRSRFSDQPLAPPQNVNQIPQNQSSYQMPPPSGEPVKKRKFVWTDADDEDLKQQQLLEKRSGIDETSPALLIGSNPALLQNLNPTLLNALQDSSKIKKKVYLPTNTGVNYIGLLIGPRGLYQKRLEEESGCKILIRGKGSQKEGSAPQPDDNDDQHVLIIGDSTESVRRANNAIERVISADESTRNKIREEQLVVAQQINNSIQPNTQMDDSMMTPYGPPSPYAYIIPVPNDCVGLIIGKGGDTIRQLQMESGAKIQVAKKEIPNSNLRNVFVEGPPDKYQRAKEMIEEIIREHRRTSDPQIHVGDINPFSGPHTKVKVPDKFVGLIIGKNGENLRGIAQRSNTRIFMPQKNQDPGAEERTIEVDGDAQSIEIAKQEVFNLIQKYMSQSNSNSYDYQKNPYGSGIAVYNQQKLASDGQAINGAVPDSLKPESGSYASSLLTENPMLAYSAAQLAGWQYDYPTQGEGQENQHQHQQQQYQGHDQAAGYDQSYYQYYQHGGQYGEAGAQGQYPPYDQQQQQEYWAQYYGQQQQPYGYHPPAGGHPAQDQTQNPEAQPSTDTANAGANYDYSQYYQNYYQQYYGGAAGGAHPGTQDPNAAAYYQHYYQNQPGQHDNQNLQAQKPTDEPKQEPGQ